MFWRARDRRAAQDRARGHGAFGSTRGRRLRPRPPAAAPRPPRRRRRLPRPRPRPPRRRRRLRGRARGRSAAGAAARGRARPAAPPEARAASLGRARAAAEAAAPPGAAADPNLAWLESEAPPEEPEGDADLTCCCNGCAACEATRVEVDGGRLACPEERKGERRCPSASRSGSRRTRAGPRAPRTCARRTAPSLCARPSRRRAASARRTSCATATSPSAGENISAAARARALLGTWLVSHAAIFARPAAPLPPPPFPPTHTPRRALSDGGGASARVDRGAARERRAARARQHARSTLRFSSVADAVRELVRARRGGAARRGARAAAASSDEMAPEAAEREARRPTSPPRSRARAARRRGLPVVARRRSRRRAARAARRRRGRGRRRCRGGAAPAGARRERLAPPPEEIVGVELGARALRALVSGWAVSRLGRAGPSRPPTSRRASSRSRGRRRSVRAPASRARARGRARRARGRRRGAARARRRRAREHRAGCRAAARSSSASARNRRPRGATGAARGRCPSPAGARTTSSIASGRAARRGSGRAASRGSWTARRACACARSLSFSRLALITSAVRACARGTEAASRVSTSMGRTTCGSTRSKCARAPGRRHNGSRRWSSALCRARLRARAAPRSARGARAEAPDGTKRLLGGVLYEIRAAVAPPVRDERRRGRERRRRRTTRRLEEGAADAPAEHEDTSGHRAHGRRAAVLPRRRQLCVPRRRAVHPQEHVGVVARPRVRRPPVARTATRSPRTAISRPRTAISAARGRRRREPAPVSASELARRVVAWSARHAWQGRPASLQEILCALIDTRALQPGDHFSDATLESALKALESDPRRLRAPPAAAQAAADRLRRRRQGDLRRPAPALSHPAAQGLRAEARHGREARVRVDAARRDAAGRQGPRAARKLQEEAGAAPPAPPAAADIDVSEDAERGSVRWVGARSRRSCGTGRWRSPRQ